MNIEAERRRLVRMLALSCGAFALALTGLVAYAALHVRWGLPLVAAAVAGGVGAQVWFISGAARGARKA